MGVTSSLINLSTTTMALSWNRLRAAMLGIAGTPWTQQGSGDATTFSNAGAGPVTGGGTGVGGLDNTGAWVRLRDPGGVREYIIQRGANATTWSLFYSRSARFTGGSPSATVRPTATDEVAIFSGLNTFAAGTFITQAIVEDAAINGVYGWWLLRTVSGTGARSECIACDPLAVGDDMSQASLGSTIDPCTHWAFVNTDTTLANVSPNSPTTRMQVIVNYGTPGQSFLPFHCPRVDGGNGNNAFPSGLPTSPWSGGGDDICALSYERGAKEGTAHEHGISHHMSWKGVSARQYPDVVQEPGGGTRAWVYFGDIAVPWPKGSTPNTT